MALDNYRRLTIPADLHVEISSLRDEIQAELNDSHQTNIKLTIPETIRLGMTFYKQRRKLVEKSQEVQKINGE